jgi:hypothetical protein
LFSQFELTLPLELKLRLEVTVRLELTLLLELTLTLELTLGLELTLLLELTLGQSRNVLSDVTYAARRRRMVNIGMVIFQQNGFMR